MGKVIEELGELSVEMATAIISCHYGNAGPLVAPIVNYLLKKGFDKVIKDVVSRHLSEMQKSKVNEVRDYAISTFYRLAVENGWEDQSVEGEAYTQSIAESIEDVFNKAVNESRKAKRILLGALLGSTMYHSNSSRPEVENYFYISTIVDRLTFRQLCLISMIGNRFSNIKGSNDDLCITDKVAISELEDLKAQGLWQPSFGMMGGPKENNHPLPLDYLLPTKTTNELKDAIIFPDEIKDDYSRVVESLDIIPINSSDFPDSFLKTFYDSIDKNKVVSEHNI